MKTKTKVKTKAEKDFLQDKLFSLALGESWSHYEGALVFTAIRVPGGWIFNIPDNPYVEQSRQTSTFVPEPPQIDWTKI